MRSFDDAALERQRRRADRLAQQRRDEPAPRPSSAAPVDLPEDRIVGIVQEVGDDAMATVLVGADEVEYVFPLDLLPEGAHEGTMLYLVLRDGRLEVIGERPTHKAEPGQSVEDRMDRHLVRRRLGDA